MRLFFLGLAVLVLAACQAKDERFYRANPQALQQALDDCSNGKMPRSECDKLDTIARDSNRLAYELQKNAQEFGKQVLLLQMELGNLQAKKPQTAEDKKIMDSLSEQLATRLAIVKWLESPEK